MPGPARKLVLPICVAALLGFAAFWSYEQQIKEYYWSLLPKRGGPEVHGLNALRVPPQATPYDRWLDRVRGHVPVFEGLVIEDVATVALHPWPQLGEGVDGLYLRFSDYQITDGRIIGLPAGGQTVPQRHLFEMGVYVVGGRGHTLFFRDHGEPLRADWQAGSLFAVPMNARYQHVSDDSAPARLLAVTSFPLMMNAAASEPFVFANEFEFVDRFDGGDDYFSRSAAAGDKRTGTNLVPDITVAPLVDNSYRGAGATTMRWAMAGNSMLDLHVTGVPPRSYAKAHRHSSDAFVLILSGEGYSLTWAGDDLANRRRIDWKKGTLFVPPTYWYHQHFNASTETSRHLAINTPILVSNLGLRFADQIETDAPQIRAEWDSEIRARAKAGR